MELTQPITLLYCATGKHTIHTYYGYLTTADCLNIDFVIKDTFRKEATRQFNPNRGMSGPMSLLESNNSEIETIGFEILETLNCQGEGWRMRNDYRAEDHLSITGPTTFPVEHMKLAQEKYPDQVTRWRKATSVRDCKNARQAWSEYNVFDKAEIALLKQTHDRNQLIHDLDNLSATQFAHKYSLRLKL